MVRSEPIVGAIILAAGQSQRMGANKLLLPLGGKAVVRHVVDAVNAAIAEPAIVVTGHESALVAAAVASARTETIFAAEHAKGLSQSLRAGMAAVPAHWNAVLICLGDMPLLPPPLIAAMARLARADSIIMPCHQGLQRNPVVWGRNFFGQLMTLRGDRGAKALLAHSADRITRLNWPCADAFHDVDTPEAIEGVRGIVAARDRL